MINIALMPLLDLLVSIKDFEEYPEGVTEKLFATRVDVGLTDDKDYEYWSCHYNTPYTDTMDIVYVVKTHL